MAEGDSDIHDMEDQQTPARVSQVDEVYERLSQFLHLSSEAAAIVLAVYDAYNPDLTEDEKAKFCQLQLSTLPDGGRSFGNTEVKRALTHAGDRFVGHRMVGKRFTGVESNDKLKLDGTETLQLPKRPTQAQKQELMQKRCRKDFPPPTVQLMNDINQAQQARHIQQGLLSVICGKQCFLPLQR